MVSQVYQDILVPNTLLAGLMQLVKDSEYSGQFISWNNNCVFFERMLNIRVNGNYPLKACLFCQFHFLAEVALM